MRVPDIPCVGDADEDEPRCRRLPGRRHMIRGASPLWPALFVGLSCVWLGLHTAAAWNEWTWQNVSHSPGPRRGHSWELFGGSVFLFGGRANDIIRRHTPRTYEIVTRNGSLVFKSYDQKLVNPPCNETDPECPTLQPIGLYFNDVWEYPLNCTRWSDLGCAYEEWKVLNPGAILGGCVIADNTETCSHPTERFDHMTSMFSDGTMLVYGGFSHRCEDYCSDMWSFNVLQCKEANRVHTDPRCSWHKVTELGSGRGAPGKRWRSAVVTDGLTWYLFGGHRMWHGFGTSNSVENRWSDLSTFPAGGYQQDLWTYSHVPKYPAVAGSWREVEPVESCFKDPGVSWEQRNDVRCVVFWPDPRAGARIIRYQEFILLHGGYRTFFPYPHSNARGAGSGTAALSSDGFSPYPTYPFYLDDLWRYNLTDGVWTELSPISPTKPAARVDHTLVLTGEVLYLFGGYRSNFYFGDLWMYNITTNRWLMKASQVHPVYHKNCTNDLVNGKVVEGQMSVWGQPTRGSDLDGLFGRATEHVFIAQPRRQAPGWDGCRDRVDERPDLPAALVYEQPRQRSGHKAIFSQDFRLMLMYGGRTLTAEQAFGLDLTHASEVMGDLWQMHIDHCPSNCSLHGRCFYGYCYCDNGYYGVDCSNTSCPGDFCFYDATEHKQHCKHCCHAPHPHGDGQLYVEDQRKVPCDHDHPGESHGICDGFGNCQCRPPYLGADCSMRDCPNDCSFNGWCDVQYPVSRCMCDAGWVGIDCSERICLNNCSYPNGYCENGICICEMTYNPYNKTVEWKPYAGTDCSYVVPFAAGAALRPTAWLAMATVLAAVAVAAVSSWAAFDGRIDLPC